MVFDDDGLGSSIDDVFGNDGSQQTRLVEALQSVLESRKKRPVESATDQCQIAAFAVLVDDWGEGVTHTIFCRNDWGTLFSKIGWQSAEMEYATLWSMVVVRNRWAFVSSDEIAGLVSERCQERIKASPASLLQLSHEMELPVLFSSPDDVVEDHRDREPTFWAMNRRGMLVRLCLDDVDHHTINLDLFFEHASESLEEQKDEIDGQ